MKILIVNKFLHPNGGSETYIFGLGNALEKLDHNVEYFGMEHEGRIVGNSANAYTSDMDFHSKNPFAKLSYSLKTIYSTEARKKIRLVLNKFQPDIVHLNNFNYQLTPSIILEIVKWREENKKECKIFFTAHDYQLLCPNHMLNNPTTHQNCEKCLGGHFANCISGKCIHGSTAKSTIGALESYFWNRKGTYKYIDRIICCSEFMKTKMDTNPVFATKTIAMHNFVEEFVPNPTDNLSVQKLPYSRYALYFGRYSQEKGILTLIDACRQLPDINFIFAGSGENASAINELPNATNVGFKSGHELDNLIVNADFSIYPSEWYENCPYSVMESQERGTPVLGANIGGIPELITDDETGWLFESGNEQALTNAILRIWSNPDMIKSCKEKLSRLSRLNAIEYACEFCQL